MRKIVNHLQPIINKILANEEKKTIIQTLSLISSIPQFKLAVDKTLSCNFNAFLNQDGILQTNKQTTKTFNK